MANRFFDQFQGTLEKGQCNLYVTVNVGAAGAVTMQTWNPSTAAYAAASSAGSKGVKSVVRNSAGSWTITLQDSYQRLLQANATFVAAAGLPAAPVMGVLSTTNVRSNTAPVVNVLFQNTSGVATDPASGEQITIQIALQNSSAV